MIKKVIRFSLFAAILLTAACVAAILWITHARANVFVHPGHAPIARLPDSAGITNYETVSFKSSDGLTLRGWFVPSQNGAVVVLVHGHGSNRTGQMGDAAILAARGYGVVMFDLRNSGESDGDTTTMGLLEVNDVQAAVEFAASRPGTDPDRLGLLGQSLGGATVIMTAARVPAVRAVAAVSAYTSLEDNIKSGVERMANLPAFPFAPLVVFWGQWEAGIDITQVRPVAEIASISPRPILLVHGELDQLVPVENAHRLYAAARQPKELFLVPAAAHGNVISVGGDGYVQKITEFFDRYLLGR
jgi:uncharacterized protein